ncbi:hypothetical protein Clacol_004885 [Clathrus columnatus]|uniref:Carboxylic ester hydrolase n=1 Tax=Clathrus columnatus TaxID=1419009 RepID=A0AAV5ABY0_9AGAM|nr:hypothetical protein Clacol_004885 [Clathrus columnatus]
MSSSHPSVRCPTLNTTFVGIKHNVYSPEFPIHQFRGIKYATVPGRFRRSQLCTVYPRVTDAKLNGPICPQQKRQGFDDLFGFVREDPPRMVVQDEFECLNLIVTCPDTTKYTRPLPVMVWIHGGSNIRGAGSSIICDPGKFVKASLELQQPIIVVNINYRLGLLGFAASDALEESNRLLGEEGVGNYGLYDQLNALIWTRKHISSFGGDPSNITLFGESAGAIDIHALLLSRINHLMPGGIASRAILQSGVVFPTAVRSIESQGSLLSRAMGRLGLTPTDINRLRNIPVDFLVAQTPGVVNATDDGIFFRDGWRNDVGSSPGNFIPLPEKIDSLMIGDCAFESALYLGAGSVGGGGGGAGIRTWSSLGIVRRVKALIRNVYKADKFLRSYGINYGPGADDEESQDAVLNVVNDVFFAWPIDKLAKGAATGRPGGRGIPVYRYVFDQESPYTFTAHHAVDLLYLFDNISMTPTERGKKAASGVGPLHSTTSTTLVQSPSSSGSDWDELDHRLGAYADDVVDDTQIAYPTYSDSYESDSDSDDSYYELSDFQYNASRIRQGMQARWIAFAQGSASGGSSSSLTRSIANRSSNVLEPLPGHPWSRDSLLVLGPEGEVGTRPIDEELPLRRRLDEWSHALESVPPELAFRIGVELSVGPKGVPPTTVGVQPFQRSRI